MITRQVIYLSRAISQTVNPDFDYCPKKCHYEKVGRIEKGERPPRSFCDECPMGNEFKIFENASVAELAEIKGAERWSFQSLLEYYNTYRDWMRGGYEESGFKPKWRRFDRRSIDAIREEIRHQERKQEWDKRIADAAAVKAGKE